MRSHKATHLVSSTVKAVESAPLICMVAAARSIASLMDVAAAPEMRERMTFTSPKTGEPVWRAWQIPHTPAELRARRLFYATWAAATFRLTGPPRPPAPGVFSRHCATAQRHGALR